MMKRFLLLLTLALSLSPSAFSQVGSVKVNPVTGELITPAASLFKSGNNLLSTASTVFNGLEITGGLSSGITFGNSTAFSLGNSSSLTVSASAVVTLSGTGVLNAVGNGDIAVAGDITAERSAIRTLTGATISGGSNTITNVSLTAGVTGILPVANGGVRAWAVKTTTYTALAGDRIQADTSGAAWTLTLPASATAGDEIPIEDATLSWGTNNLTIARNGLKINGGTSNYTADVIGGKLSCVYISAGYGWSIK